jgi:DNA-binding NarL/FixJ family response regulator
MPLFRVLVVDDYEPFRQRVCLSLERRTDFKVIGQASDGLEAVQKAEELQPDLILLDIGLPKLNGMDVARQLRRLVPVAKIVFLSQESSPDIVREGFNLGAMGYVHKPRAHSDLVPALEAVIGGKQFVSRNLERESSENTIPMTSRGKKVQFYSDDAFVPDRFATFIAAAFILTAAVVVLGVYSCRQSSVISRIAAHESVLNASIAQLRIQLQEATAKINDVAAVHAAQAASAANIAQSDARAAAATADAQATRLRRLQTAVSNQDKKLQATQAEVTKTRSDLEGNLNSTRDELNGSIARTHEELVVLENRGERNYYEFDAAKSKQFQRTGPLSISVRKTDVKHGYVDLVLLVNDREISKKNVNLYEPVWIYETKDAQPVQVVVNRIDKNLAHGYISAPKYSPTDLNAIASPAVPPAAIR